MLELLAARQRECRTGVLVPDRPPDLGEQARVGRVASDHLDGDRTAVGRGRDEPGLTPLLVRVDREIGDRDAEREELVRNLRKGRRSRGRSDREMQRGRDTPAQRDARDDVVGEADETEDRAERRDAEREEHEPARGPQQVRSGHEQHRRGDGEQGDRVLGDGAVEDESGGVPFVVDVDERPQTDGGQPAEGTGNGQDEHQAEPAREQQGEQQRGERAVRRGLEPELRELVDPIG